MKSKKDEPISYWQWCRDNSKRLFYEYAGERGFFGYRKETFKKIIDKRQYYELDDVETTLEFLKNADKDGSDEEEVQNFDAIYHDLRFGKYHPIVSSTPNSEHETQKDSSTTTTSSDSEEEEEVMELKSPKSNK